MEYLGFKLWNKISSEIQNAFPKGSGYIYVTVTFIKSRILFLAFLGLHRNSLILLLIPEPI